MTDHKPPDRAWTIAAAGLGITLATLALMLATEPKLAIVWDEGYSLGREARLRLWFSALKNPARFASTWQPPLFELVQPDRVLAPRADQVDTRAKLLFEPESRDWFWPFAREEPHGHPPFYALVGLVGDLLPDSFSVLSRARFGPILVFSVMSGAIFLFTAARLGLWPGLLASGAWVFQPRLFGHGHYATYDALLTSLWVGSILAFTMAVEPVERPRRARWAWMAIFGVLCGCAADTKLTGWFVPLPFLAWSVLYRDRRGFTTLAVGGLIAALLLYGLNPPWWTDPITGIERFLRSNLTRGKTVTIPALFLGRVYRTPNESLPWFNTIVWTVFVTPVGFLSLALVGVIRALRRARSEPFALLIVGHWIFLLILRALPHTPGHDGERQFLPAFGILALVAGLGAASVVERIGRWGKALIVSALIEGAASVALMMPVPLSYYSPAIGGLAGAAALGMEPTYYWDGLSDEALAWLNHHTGPGQKVRFVNYPTSWIYLRRTGRLEPPIFPFEPGEWTWYVLQNRPAILTPLDRALLARGQPAYVVRKGTTPLIWIFPYSEVEAIQRVPLR